VEGRFLGVGIGRKWGEAEVVFLLRLENVLWFIFMGLRRFLNVELLRLAATAAKASFSPPALPLTPPPLCAPASTGDTHVRRGPKTPGTQFIILSLRNAPL
jgi:hypothetical protein